MSKLRWFSIVLVLFSAGVFAAKRPLTIAPQYSNSPSGTTNLTLKPGSTNGCSCHGAADSNIHATLSGPTQLYAGDYGIYQIAGSKTGLATATNFGFDVAASDAATVLGTQPGEPTQTYDVGGNANNREVTHMPTLRQINTGTNYYQFRFNMPGNASNGSSHTVYGLIGGPGLGGWNNASSLAITTKARPSAPASLTPGSPTSTTIPLSWGAAGPQYRLLYKTGTYPSSTSDGTIAYEGTGTSYTVTGLAASTAYYFAVFSKDIGVSSGNAFYSTSSAQATATTSAPVVTTWWVNASGGNDANDGMSYPTAFKTIKQAMTMALSGDMINVMPGTYNMTNGETFPIAMKSGVKLIGYMGAGVTIVDATGANKRVFNVFSGNGQTRIEGFTITGGNVMAPADGSNAQGGGILTDDADQATITRNIITGNQCYGYNGTVGTSFPAGGYAYGGGLVLVGTETLSNNVISNNLVRGGDGGCACGVNGPGGNGGDGHGGAMWVFGNPTIVNNTISGNSAAGGNGGASTVTGNGGNAGSGYYGAIDTSSQGNAFNNIIASNSVSAGTPGSPGGLAGSALTGGINSSLTNSYNLYYNNTGGDGVAGGTGNIYGSDPKFVGGGDFHIAPGSPAASAGTPTGAPAIDLDSITRPNPPSLGAYEAPRKFRKDFNADNYSDLVWRNATTGQSTVWLMNGNTPQNGSGVTSLQFGDNSFTMAGVGDFDGDGHADLVWRNNTTGQDILWLMNGATVMAGSGNFNSVPAPWIIAGVGDFNGDGKSDIMWRNPQSGDNSMWLLNGLTVQNGSGTLNAVGDPNWHVGAVGDFNGDGRSDILWRNDVSGTSSIWMMSGASVGPGSGLTNLQLGSSWRVAIAGDFNGDGRSDILWRNVSTGQNIIWLMNGTTVIGGNETLQIADTNWNALASGDFNNDGYDDLLWRDDVTGVTSMWMMNGLLIGSGSGTMANVPPPWTVVGPR